MKLKLFGSIIILILLWPAAAGAQTEQWVARHKELGSNRDVVTAMAMDSGVIYVTGYSFVSPTIYMMTVAYDSAGNELWVARYEAGLAQAIAVDSIRGNVYVTGQGRRGSASDYVTVAYDTATGTQQWVATYHGARDEEQDGAVAVAVNPETGNIYVTGSDDLARTTIAYGPDGEELWTAHFQAITTEDTPRAIAVDSVTGNVYVAGHTNGVYTTVAYDSDGVELWVGHYNGGMGFDRAYAMAVDETTGNVYVTGQSVGLGHYNEYATVAYDTSGSQLWVARYGVTNGSDDRDNLAKAITVDSAGNVYVTGVSWRPAMGFSYATVAYNTTGRQLWAARYLGPIGSSFASAIAVDSNGNVYVTGGSRESPSNLDYATVAYDSSGRQSWVARYDGPAHGNDSAAAVAVDGAGNVYVAGSSADVEGAESDYTTIKYTQP